MRPHTIRSHCLISADSLRRPLAILVIAAFILSGLGGMAAQTAASSTERTTLVIGLLEPVDSLNPFRGINNNAYVFYSMVYDYLVGVDEDLKPKPNLALSWGVVTSELPVGSVWEYNLTRNAKWHDGEPFSADDVVFTINYQSGSNFNTIWAYQPYTIRIDHAEKMDESTVRIHFKDSSGSPAACIYGDSLMIPILPKHLWTNITPSAAQYEYENDHPVGTGPFMCTDSISSEMAQGTQLTLLRNPDYHGFADYGQEIGYDKVVLKFYTDAERMPLDVESGALDLAAMGPQAYESLLSDLKAKPSTSIGTYSGLSCTGDSTVIGICMLSAGGKDTNLLRLDPAVRKAMAYAIDREHVKDAIYAGHAQLGYTVFSPIFPKWYWQPSISEEHNYNLALANQILEDAGYVWKDSSHTIRVAGPNNTYAPLDEHGQPNPLSFGVIVEKEIPEDRLIASYLVSQLAMIGIMVRPLVVTSAEWETVVYTGAYDLTVTYWSGDPDPNYLLYVESSYAIGSWSDNFYSNPSYDENYTKSMAATDYIQRKGFVENCERMVYEDLPYIVLAYTYGCYAWRTDQFEGWGDWKAHPALQPTNYWTANQLFFNLKPVHPAGDSLQLVTIGVVGGSVAACASMFTYFMIYRPRRREAEHRLKESVKGPEKKK